MGKVEVLVTNNHAFTVCKCGEELTLNKPVYNQTYYEGECSKCISKYRYKNNHLVKVQ
jgi:hypothetical protein